MQPSRLHGEACAEACGESSLRHAIKCSRGNQRVSFSGSGASVQSRCGSDGTQTRTWNLVECRNQPSRVYDQLVDRMRVLRVLQLLLIYTRLFGAADKRLSFQPSYGCRRHRRTQGSTRPRPSSSAWSLLQRSSSGWVRRIEFHFLPSSDSRISISILRPCDLPVIKPLSKSCLIRARNRLR